MEDFLKGLVWGAGIGMIVAASVVAKNKKLAAKIRNGMDMAEEKIIEAKEVIEEKLEEDKEKYCDKNGICYDDELKREFSKKSKK